MNKIQTFRWIVVLISLGLSLLLACGDDRQQTKEAPKRLKGKSIAEMWSAHKVPLSTFRALLDSLPDAQLVDVRTPREYANGHIPGSINLDIRAEDFEERIRAKVGIDRPVLLYCQMGIRSGRAANLMRDMGYSELYDLEGGFAIWKKSEISSSPDSASAPVVPE